MKPSVILQISLRKGAPEQELKVTVMNTESSFDFGLNFRSYHQVVVHFPDRGEVEKKQ